MKKLFWIICIFALSFSSISFAEDTEILDDVPPPPSISYDSNYMDEPEVTIKKETQE